MSTEKTGSNDGQKPEGTPPLTVDTHFDTPLVTITDDDAAVSSATQEAEELDEPLFFTVSESKFLTLYIISFGLYGIYWFYKNWALQRRIMEKRIFPVMRGLFSIFFCHSLFRRLAQQSQGLDKAEHFQPDFLAGIYVLSILLDILLDSISTNTLLLQGVSALWSGLASVGLFLIGAYPLLRAQSLINRINGDILGFANNRYNWGNYLLMAFGLLIWALLALGMLTESLGIIIE